ncbi:MAG TPA: Hsp20/alpha crystallin family protein [Gemmatimonadaceae bacterium]|nr:Hsp20/alpha crystallin family protein [Gemmatimonadaceae bacterium]
MLTSRSLNSTLDRMLTLNRVLDEALAGTLDGSREGRAWAPALDLVERHDAYLIALEIPGVDPATIDISFEQNVLTVRGSKPMGFELSKSAELRVYSAERVVGTFERSVRLPEFVEGEKIAADYNHGVLFLTIPKVQAAQPRKIEIAGVDTKKQINA